jgi:RHS repeat-associated protein
MTPYRRVSARRTDLQVSSVAARHEWQTRQGRAAAAVRRLVLATLLLCWHAHDTWAQTETVTYVHTDTVGSVRLLTNASGAVVAQHDYTPFGEEPNSPTLPSVNPRRFAGKERDGETGFDYFGGRYLHAAPGRLTTVDPVLNVPAALADPQRWNRYAYVRNSPLRLTDPDGRDPFVITGAIGAVVYGGWRAGWNVGAGRPWYEGVGVEASKGFLVGATLGLAAPAMLPAEAFTSAHTGATLSAGAAAASAAVGRARELRVVQAVGGRLANDFRVSLPGVGTTAVDVFGSAGEYIGVGGPAKANNLSHLGTQLKVLAGAAGRAGVSAQYYFAKGTPDEAVRLAQKWLGKGNVFIIE